MLNRLAQVWSYSSVFFSLWLLLRKFGTLDGWTWPELALLIGFQLLSYSIGAAFSLVQMRDMEEIVRQGRFDLLMLKPISPWVYLVFSGFNFGYVGHVILALGLMGWALPQVEAIWSLSSLLYFIGAISSASMLTAALITMIGANALIIVRSNHLFSIFFGLSEMSRYPLTLFPSAIQVILLSVIPLAFTSFVPVATILGKPIPLYSGVGSGLALLIGPMVAGIAVAHWRFVTRRYQSAGG